MGEWRDIESAPKDGTQVLITGGTFENSMSMGGPGPYQAVTIASYNYYGGEWQGENAGGHDEYYWHHPTHWMPLPAPPGTETGIPILRLKDPSDT
jgi:hypothetical protein